MNVEHPVKLKPYLDYRKGNHKVSTPSPWLRRLTAPLSAVEVIIWAIIMLAGMVILGVAG